VSGASSPPSDPRPAYLVALFVAATWGAVVFATWGVMTVVLDREPVEVPAPAAHLLLGLALAGAVVWFGVARSPVTTAPALLAVGTGASAYLVLVAWAATVGLPLLVEQASSPFVLVAAALAAAAPAVARPFLRRPR
jgi:hypothetical protein